MTSSSLLRKPSECLASARTKVCCIFDCYYQDFLLNFHVRVSRTEIEKKILKDSGVDARSSVMNLSKIDMTKNKRRENNIQMERDHVNRNIIASEDPVVRDVASHSS